MSVMSERQKGVCKWFNASRGYGFITDVNRQDLFVHYSAISGSGFRTLADQENVEFDVEIDSNERKKAINVTGPNGEPVRGDRYRPGGASESGVNQQGVSGGNGVFNGGFRGNRNDNVGRGGANKQYDYRPDANMYRNYMREVGDNQQQPLRQQYAPQAAEMIQYENSRDGYAQVAENQGYLMHNNGAPMYNTMVGGNGPHSNEGYRYSGGQAQHYSSNYQTRGEGVFNAAPTRNVY